MRAALLTLAFLLLNETPTTEIYTLSLHDALPISRLDEHRLARVAELAHEREDAGLDQRSEEHTSELQSRRELVCRLLLEKKKRDFHGSCGPGSPNAAVPACLTVCPHLADLRYEVH